MANRNFKPNIYDSQLCIFTLSMDGIFLQANDAAFRLFNSENGPIIGTPFESYLLHSDLEKFSDTLGRVIKGTDMQLDCDLELSTERGDETSNPIRFLFSSQYDADGSVQSIVVIADINFSQYSSKHIPRKSDQHSELLYDFIPQQIWIADLKGKLSYVNKRVIDFYGSSIEAVLGMGWFNNLHPEDVEEMGVRWAEAAKLGEPFEIEFRLLNSEGEYRWLVGMAMPVMDQHGEICEWIGTSTDVTTARQRSEELATLNQLLGESQKIAKVGGWELNVVTGILFWTSETYRIHDTTPEEFDPTVDAGVGYFLPESKQIISDALGDALSEGKGYDLELETYTTKGRKIDVRTTCVVTMEDNKPVKLTGIFQDISLQKINLRELNNTNKKLQNANSVLKRIAHYDALTNLPNRSLLADRMQQAMLQNKRRGRSVAVAFLDLDGFKEVNDSYGHSVGDDLLIKISKRLKETLRDGDTVARIGGDEFVAVLGDLPSPKDCEPLVERMLSAVSSSGQIADKNLQTSASIGVTVYPQDDVDADQLIRHADQAMYLAKQAGRNCFHIFDVANDTAAKTKNEDLETIRHALEQNQFRLYYQPKVNMNTAEVIGVEALIRWQHPDRGLLPPAVFLPIIDDHPLGISIGDWVINEALKQISVWQSAGLEIPVSVNISALQLQEPNFVDQLKEILASHSSIHTSNIEFEILETSALRDITKVSKVIKECNAIGIDFALDDFGTGYSSLTYLKRLPAKLLKIDQSFVRDMLVDKDDLAIIEGIIGLAKAFNREVIAEGVETEAHGRKLQELGCYLAQGYGIARPMPASELPQWCQEWHASPSWKDF